jgi:RNA polymerase sigma factor (sigma-70 family)
MARPVNPGTGFGQGQARETRVEEEPLGTDFPDGELIAGSVADPAMFAEVFDRHYRELHRYLRRQIGADLAADLAAETFVTAFARRGSYRPQSTDARPWLYGIAHNLLRNHRRQQRRRLAAYARHGAEPVADAAAEAEFALADARADATAVSARLEQILARMADRDREVLQLFAWADMSYAEVAEALGIPLGTVRSRLNRARRQLRALLENDPPQELLGERHG